jgi:hypothetical protein
LDRRPNAIEDLGHDLSVANALGPVRTDDRGSLGQSIALEYRQGFFGKSGSDRVGNGGPSTCKLTDMAPEKGLEGPGRFRLGAGHLGKLQPVLEGRRDRIDERWSNDLS